jgi:hypothetical protein
MEEIIQFEDGTLVYIGPAGDAPDEYSMAISAREVLGTFEEAAGQIVHRLAALAATVREVGGPSELAVEVGVMFEGSAGLPVIARASAESHLKITATWKRSEETSHDDLRG